MRVSPLVFKLGYKINRVVTESFVVCCPHCEERFRFTDFDKSYEFMNAHALNVHNEEVGKKHEYNPKGVSNDG